MTLVRVSPSGPPVIFNQDVLSVFGRTGVVVAELGDYDSTLVGNDSAIPVATVTEALDALVDTNGILNASTVSGITVTDALDALRAAQSEPAGTIHDTFLGGATTGAAAAASLNAIIGDKRWNVGTSGTQTGMSVTKRVGELGAIGVYRITAPTVGGSFANMYLGSGAGDLQFQMLNELTFRARVVGNAAGQQTWLGLMNSISGTANSGINPQLVFRTVGGTTNFQTTTGGSAGAYTTKDTGVPVDALYHDFRVVQTSASSYDFYIDGVLRTTHDGAGGDNVPLQTNSCNPTVGVRGNATPSVIDVDDYRFIPN